MSPRSSETDSSPSKFINDQRCVELDTMVEMYERVLSELLDTHAPLKYKGCG